MDNLEGANTSEQMITPKKTKTADGGPSIWEFFQPCPESIHHAICMLCQYPKKLALGKTRFGTTSGTYGLNYHVRNKHPDEFQELFPNLSSPSETEIDGKIQKINNLNNLVKPKLEKKSPKLGGPKSIQKKRDRYQLNNLGPKPDVGTEESGIYSTTKDANVPPNRVINWKNTKFIRKQNNGGGGGKSGNPVLEHILAGKSPNLTITRGDLLKNNIKSPEGDDPLGENLAEVQYHKMRVICAQAEEAEDKANLAKEKFKIEQISGYYKIQEAISNAKKAGYELKDDDPLYNLEI